MRHARRRRPTGPSSPLRYKTIDPVEETADEGSRPPTNLRVDGGGGEEGENNAVDPLGEDAIGGGDDRAVSVGGADDWTSAPRTLGSLFLREEDADRDRGPPGGGDGASPFDGLQENSFVQYLMNLKLEEEEHREKEAGGVRRGSEPEDATGKGASPPFGTTLRIDQVRVLCSRWHSSFARSAGSVKVSCPARTQFD